MTCIYGSKRIGLAALAATTCLTVAFAAYAQTTYNKTLYVNAAAEAMATGSVDRLALDLPPTATASVSPSNGPAPLSVNFNGSASSPNGPVVLYEWDFDGDGTFDYSSSSTGNTTHTFDNPGTRQAVFRVTDAIGMTTTISDFLLEVRVGPALSPTAVASASPSQGTGPLLVNFGCSGSSDPDGSIVLYEWDFNYSGAFAADYSSPSSCSTTHAYTAGGLHYAALRVTDNDGLSGVDLKAVSVHFDDCDNWPVDNITQGTCYDTIQAAIETSVNGDEIVVEPGTYDEGIVFNGKAVTLRSTDPTDPAVVESTIIAGGGYGSPTAIVSFLSGEGPGSVLDGFSVQSDASRWVHGIKCISSDPTIRNCVIRYNRGQCAGGGLHLSDSSPLVVNCIITDNGAFYGLCTGGDEVGGGGILCTGPTSSPYIVNSIIANNLTADGLNCSSVLWSCTQMPTPGGSGGGVLLQDSASITMINCLVANNRTGNGGTCSSSICCDPWPSCSEPGGNGAGISAQDGAATIINCTFAGNVTAPGGHGQAIDANSNTTVANSIVWGSNGYVIYGSPVVSYSNARNWIWGSDNIDADPMFVDPDGPDDVPGTKDDDFRLLYTSPCVDKGDTASLPSDTADLDDDGNTAEQIPFDLAYSDRVRDSIVDMGAYELAPCFCSGDCPVHNSMQGVDYDCIQDAIDDAEDGDSILVAPGTYHETIDFLGKAITLKSTTGQYVTTVDATDIGGSAVTCVSGEGPGTVLRGFTITGGSAVDGGGMYNVGSSPTVFGCIFSQNTATDTGGGMYNENASPTLTNCTFSGNSAGDGGGMSNISNSSPTLTDCTFTGNSFTTQGGGMANDASSPVVIHCAFDENSGGASYPHRSDTHQLHIRRKHSRQQRRWNVQYGE
ncbi:MAG: PKD domain-containing protein [Planctomycetota bacterium]